MDRDNLFGLFKESIQGQVEHHLKAEFGAQENLTFKFEIPPEPSLGHLALACFPFAKATKQAPPKIAQLLAQKIEPNRAWERVVASGPYLNFFLNPKELASLVFPQVLKPDYGCSSLGKGQKVMLEYSSPNTNKPLHLGHGRNNLLGMALSRLLETAGYQVIKANLVNDRGIHICKSMLAYQERWVYAELPLPPTPQSTGKKGDKLVGDFYVAYDKKSKEDPTVADQAAQLLRDWELGKPEVLALWRQMNDWVLKGFEVTYQRLGCEFDRFYFESKTYQSGREIVLKAFGQGLCGKEDNGAISVELDDPNQPKKILLRGDGTSMYITQDLGTTVQKFQDYAPLDRCLFVVGNEQDQHFKTLFEVLGRFGYSFGLEHISYGMITLPEGKMKSREGTVVDLDDLLDELKGMAAEEILAREMFDPQTQGPQIEFTAEAIGQGALKFLILKSGAAKEITFNPKESLSFEGATGPYLQYTHARISSLLAKAATEPAVEPKLEIGADWNEGETGLLLALAKYYEVLLASVTDRNPGALCNYLFELCRSFNKYYYDTPVLKAETRTLVEARLGLCLAVQAVLAKGLRLLGIEPLTKM
ncbi:MAG: arginine--tRNA ligase [Candidatus Lambdaproteobacteria bacterium RIFOXYD1_FULL_56_27]|uniref:Arginine--tRNA ligase n=1 Tax=Candidatus Lambdaproteobacteria bacterium RIFOXYD2_FULL_56_26 TaxID=1817773 RepID=A0A1F6H3H6_9PROT|nr:MAG: arginine--tRNA ligase [Candidatus Lambdaproteobacteria bacterium RIFOXYC1_FULL_56_13]OGH04854.1 MAG: arginine--tRNA ligase [Candidatus Lambdaproteobacteria bacterium RIFOXYD2_FULL_56_26]OGH09319.1 MAG: arginine--tRNA ligase [Candidatus Lambdaproteobacteria bacterium RIFOXYD1_FULL_56_27]